MIKNKDLPTPCHYDCTLFGNSSLNTLSHNLRAYWTIDGWVSWPWNTNGFLGRIFTTQNSSHNDVFSLRITQFEPCNLRSCVTFDFWWHSWRTFLQVLSAAIRRRYFLVVIWCIIFNNSNVTQKRVFLLLMQLGSNTFDLLAFIV